MNPSGFRVGDAGRFCTADTKYEPLYRLIGWLRTLNGFSDRATYMVQADMPALNVSLDDHKAALSYFTIWKRNRYAANQKFTFVDQPMHSMMHFVVLLQPPSPKKRSLHVNESSGRIIQQCVHNRIQNVLYSSDLNITFVSIVVLIHRFQPSNIVMRMGNYMDIHVICFPRRTRLQ